MIDTKYPYKATLVSMPDAKIAPRMFTVGNVYEVTGEIGNCIIVTTDTDDKAIVSDSRVTPMQDFRRN